MQSEYYSLPTNSADRSEPLGAVSTKMYFAENTLEYIENRYCNTTALPHQLIKDAYMYPLMRSVIGQVLAVNLVCLLAPAEALG